MNSSHDTLSEFFHRHRERGEPMVLATIVHTIGSTYRKAGAQMLIGADGTAAGLLSGGCLESDLLERAQRVLRTRAAEIASYDTRASDDVIWGIGLGCEGAMRILLTLLDTSNGYQPFAFIDAARAERERAAFALVVSSSAELALGRAFRISADGGALEAFNGTFTRSLSTAIPSLSAHTALPALPPVAVQVHAADAELLAIPIQSNLRVLVLGAGADAQPLVQIAALLGWHVTVFDHRAAYAVRAQFPGAADVLLAAATELPSKLDLNSFDAAVVMSHHLTSDAAYLRALTSTQLRYIGLLGPAPRRLRLLAEIGADAAQLSGRLRGPVGLDIGAHTPETIALAIASEIQATLSGRSGRPFSETA